MAVRNNPVLGYIECDGCQGRASVHQTSRGAGRYLYTRCGACGVDQRTGAAVQSRLWWGTGWLDGSPGVRPPNVEDAVDDSGPAPVVAPVVVPVVEPVDSGRSGWFWAAVGAAALGVSVMLRGWR